MAKNENEKREITLTEDQEDTVAEYVAGREMACKVFNLTAPTDEMVIGTCDIVLGSGDTKKSQQLAYDRLIKCGEIAEAQFAARTSAMVFELYAALFGEDE